MRLHVGATLRTGEQPELQMSTRCQKGCSSARPDVEQLLLGGTPRGLLKAFLGCVSEEWANILLLACCSQEVATDSIFCNQKMVERVVGYGSYCVCTD